METLKGFGFRLESMASDEKLESKNAKDSKKTKGTLAWMEKPMRELREGEVLLRNIACAINPVDYKLLDFFGASEEGRIMGLDGVGTIVESKSKEIDTNRFYAYHANLHCDGSFAFHTIMSDYALFPLEMTVTAYRSAIFSSTISCPQDPASYPYWLEIQNKAKEARASIARIASVICPGLTAIQCVEKVGEKSLRGREVLVIGAGGSVGRILSFLCAKAGARVTAISHMKYKESHIAQSLNYDEFLAQKEGLEFFAVFDCSGRLDPSILLPLIGYYGHFVGVVGRVDSNPLPHFSTCISLHEIALGAIHTKGDALCFEILRSQAKRLFNLLSESSFKSILPPLEVIDFKEIPTALNALKTNNLGQKFVALM